jgi:large conductance mechanosensitive channel
MTGFKNFVLRGNLVEIAVGLILAVAFSQVVSSFTAWLTSLLPDAADDVFSTTTYFGRFMNAVIAFLLIAAVVYYLVVLPYTKAKERFFPADEAGTPADVALLEEIRDLLATRGGSV